MPEWKIRTRGDSGPGHKPRVYFTCHPEDMGRYFDKVCKDILKLQDCAIYYTEDMAAAIAPEDRETDLGSVNLLVVPVTCRLLTTPNRAMDEDVPYALQQHIPVLPFMMEPGIDALYARPDKFGELQYISPNSRDLTEIAYEEKLKKYLESVLISDEMAKRVRAAFDAYIFLSYRKKDRKYANALMRLIHSKPEFRDIAIWYDEFLSPGESFKENIDRMLRDSKLFTLLVTPNLLEEPNYVMDQEYPMAKQLGMQILPAQMENTDGGLLAEKYRDIPQCLDPHEEAALRQRLLEALSAVAVRSNDSDPMHNYLIGIAYLEGIDVEVDRKRGVELITAAAEADLPEAMEKLYGMYRSGTCVALDYHRAAHWASRLASYYIEKLGVEHSVTVFALSNLALAYSDLGEYQKAAQLQEKICVTQSKVLDEHPAVLLESLTNLANSYSACGEYSKALKFRQQVYQWYCEFFAEEYPAAVDALHNLAVSYSDIGDHRKSLELTEKAYALRCRVLGEEQPDTVSTLHNLAVYYRDTGEYEKALELAQKAYALRGRMLGEDHPDTISALENMAICLSSLGEHRKALELKEKAYDRRCKLLGEEHPDTLAALSSLGVSYSAVKEHEKALECKERAYTLRCKVLGAEYPSTLNTLGNLAVSYSNLGEYEKALELKEKVYDSLCKALGQEHPDVLTAMSNLAVGYWDAGNGEKAHVMIRQVYALRCKVLGKTHPDTIHTMGNVSRSYRKLGHYFTAAVWEWKQTYGNLRCYLTALAREFQLAFWDRKSSD